MFLSESLISHSSKKKLVTNFKKDIACSSVGVFTQSVNRQEENCAGRRRHGDSRTGEWRTRDAAAGLSDSDFLRVINIINIFILVRVIAPTPTACSAWDSLRVWKQRNVSQYDGHV